MKRYHVTYSYNGEHIDFGVVCAISKDGAQREVLRVNFSDCRENWEWIQGCLTAKEIKDEIWPGGVDPEGNFSRC